MSAVFRRWSRMPGVLSRYRMSTASQEGVASGKAAAGAAQWAGYAVFGSITLGTAYLGAWQLERYKWKQGELQKRIEALNAEPVEWPTEVAEQEKLMYHRVTLSGVYDYEHQVFVGPRPAPADVPAATTRGTDSLGYYIVTPLIRSDGKGTVLINRGWAPTSYFQRGDESLNPRRSTVVTVTGVAREGEKPTSMMVLQESQFADQLPAFQLTSLADRTNTQVSHCLIDAVEPVEFKVFPATKQLPAFQDFHIMPFNHLVYAVTWFTLAGAGVLMTYMRFRKGSKLAARTAKTLKPK